MGIPSSNMGRPAINRTPSDGLNRQPLNWTHQSVRLRGRRPITGRRAPGKVPGVSDPDVPALGPHSCHVLPRPGLSKGLRVPPSCVDESGPRQVSPVDPESSPCDLPTVEQPPGIRVRAPQPSVIGSRSSPAWGPSRRISLQLPMEIKAPSRASGLRAPGRSPGDPAVDYRHTDEPAMQGAWLQADGAWIPGRESLSKFPQIVGHPRSMVGERSLVYRSVDQTFRMPSILSALRANHPIVQRSACRTESHPQGRLAR
jgi:hypothetical protein